MGQIVGGGSSGEDDYGDAAAAAEQDRCLKWTRQSADHYMFRYSFDPETFSFVWREATGSNAPVIVAAPPSDQQFRAKRLCHWWRYLPTQKC